MRRPAMDGSGRSVEEYGYTTEPGETFLIGDGMVPSCEGEINGN